ncbi:hypothetical protein PCL_10597 [Purpureocillium lilacinum]|uniref:Uncharacterized protein n=1 Tax=Purpureocillium lilacinum TaxID=33203 RepID=A0A2U3EBR6_PURLI|nr:hypothetical protein PCL_10597 [Purpureocillium lilacinum]
MPPANLHWKIAADVGARDDAVQAGLPVCLPGVVVAPGAPQNFIGARSRSRGGVRAAMSALYQMGLRTTTVTVLKRSQTHVRDMPTAAARSGDGLSAQRRVFRSNPIHPIRPFVASVYGLAHPTSFSPLRLPFPVPVAVPVLAVPPRRRRRCIVSPTMRPGSI